MKVVTKFNIALVSLVGSLFAILIYLNNTSDFSNINCIAATVKCYKYDIAYAFGIFIPILFLSTAMGLVKEKVFRPWFYFSITFATMYIYIVVSSKSNSGDLILSTNQVNLSVWFIYILFSTLIISVQYFRHRNKK